MASIGSNIAEGAGRGTLPDYSRFIGYALGSTNEAEDQLRLARDLGYVNPTDWTALDAELSAIRRMLTALRAYLSNRAHRHR